MNKIVLKALVVCCIMVSCKSKEKDDRLAFGCELFKIGNYQFFSPKVYERPIIFKKGAHDLINDDYVPLWYAGYCAENMPSYFDTKEVFLKHVHSSQIKKRSTAYFEKFYDHYKKKPQGIDGLNHKDFHLLFRGTVSVKNLSSGNEYMLVAGKSYIENESDYDKNTEFYNADVKDMLAFVLEDGVYKSVDIDRVVGHFSKQQYDKVYGVLNVQTLVNTPCFENVNTINKLNFDKAKLPGWVYNKTEFDE